jgi:2-C-methyl-D-erythritol 4-phosphate cytidylyltransferase/2-C-methyl-D-erythritol 2,4-cyclodiphosphate synthase
MAAMSDSAVVIVAAGKGERAGGAVPKQYRELAGRPLLAWTLDRFARHPRIGALQVVIDPGHRALYDAAAAGFATASPVAGGADRQSSVLAGRWH